MTDNLKDALKRLSAISPKLNAATDEAAGVVAVVETFLNETCSIGLSVDVPLEGVSEAGSHAPAALSYRRVEGRYRLAVVIWATDEPDRGDQAKGGLLVRPWVSAPRDLKLRSFSKLPELLTQLAEEAERLTDAASLTAHAVRDILKALPHMAGIDAPNKPDRRPAPPGHFSFERCTEDAKRVIALAHQEALRLNAESCGAEHLLLGLLKEGKDLAANVLREIGLNLMEVREEVQKLIPRGSGKGTNRKLTMTDNAKKVLEWASEEAASLGHHWIATEHVLLGLLREPGVAAGVLGDLGVTLERARAEIDRLTRQ